MEEVAPEIAESEVEQVPEVVVVYHWYVYGGVPPVAEAVRVMLCPSSMVGAEGVGADALSGILVMLPKLTLGITPLGG